MRIDRFIVRGDRDEDLRHELERIAFRRSRGVDDWGDAVRERQLQRRLADREFERSRHTEKVWAT